MFHIKSHPYSLLEVLNIKKHTEYKGVVCSREMHLHMRVFCTAINPVKHMNKCQLRLAEIDCKKNVKRVKGDLLCFFTF